MAMAIATAMAMAIAMAVAMAMAMAMGLGVARPPGLRPAGGLDLGKGLGRARRWLWRLGRPLPRIGKVP